MPSSSLSSSSERRVRHPTTAAVTTSSSSSSSSRRTTTTDDAHAITQSLRRSQQLLQHELDRVSHVSQAIYEDGVLLDATKSHHEQLSDDVKQSHKALLQLKFQQQKERLVFLIAVVFYVVVVLYVLWTRLPLFGIDYVLLLLWKGGTRLFVGISSSRATDTEL